MLGGRIQQGAAPQKPATEQTARGKANAGKETAPTTNFTWFEELPGCKNT